MSARPQLLLPLMLAACGPLAQTGSGLTGPIQIRQEAAIRFGDLMKTGAPVMQVAVERQGNATLLVRQTTRRGVDSYLSSDGLALGMRGGLLVATAGFGGDMVGSDVSESLNSIAGARAGESRRFHSFLDGENKVATRTFVCMFRDRGRREVSVGTRSGELRRVTTLLIEEDCDGRDHAFSNLYWLDRQGSVVQSRQWAGHANGALVLRAVLD